MTTAYAGYFDILNSVAGTTIANAYGVYILNNATTGTITNRYDLYAASANANNYFAGSVGIGAKTPAATLEVNGTAKFDGAVTFAAGQTFPIPAGGVTDAMLANPYSGVGACAAGNVVMALTRNATPTCVTASTGTVTSVATASGLTGGPITTTGTLGIDTTVVPELGINNFFTTSQFVEGYLDAFGIGNGTALYGFNTTTGASTPTLYLENDDSTSGGDWVFDAVGPSFGGQCTIDVTGNLFCTGTLSPVIKTSDNRQVGLYAVQSSENWIEDYGSGALVNGVATINIEPQFAETVTADASYHVFLTPNGDCEGLYVTQKGASSFEVHELKGGRSNVQFDYRIVAHRRGFEAARLPDLTAKFQKKVQVPARPKVAVASQH